MQKRLLILSLSLMLGTGTLAAISVATAQPAPGTVNRDVQIERRVRPLPQPSAEELVQRRTDMCRNQLARTAGRLAEMEVRLDITAGQRAAFNRWRDLRLATARRQADACASRPIPMGRADITPPSPVERLTQEEQRLRARLADLTAERPALEALYNGLSPEQRQKFTPQGGPRNGMDRGGPRTRIMMQDRVFGRPGGTVIVPPPPPPQ